MMSKKICIIHPVDPTTDFLDQIYMGLDDSQINLLRLKNKSDHDSFYESPPEEKRVLFLGHGTTDSLNGAMNDNYEQKHFISEKQLTVLSKKDVILFSCRSNQYIKKFLKECNLNNGIGFPNMITDIEEIPYYDDPERAEELTQEDINIFKQMLVRIMKNSLSDFILLDLSLDEYYNRIKLRINVEIINFYKEKKDISSLGKMLLDLRKGLLIKRN